MTNGEKVVQLFPNAQVDQGETRIYVWLDHSSTTFDRKWWEAEYIEPSKSKIPTGSTTKNNLGVDCISRDEVCRYVAEFVNNEFSTREEEELIDNIITGIECIPSVAPQEPRWIPVSERLPEPFMFVNATCRSLVDDRENWVVETVYVPIPKEVNEHGYSDWGNIPMLNWGEAEVIAWIERIIPQPYKAESEDKE